ncbi:MAG: hypothetical protein HQL22_05050 [Candidatus Omnitrophica bacterium]|nr:hypothetical protein [Candidatus Omnitrophota bacterium]
MIFCILVLEACIKVKKFKQNQQDRSSLQWCVLFLFLSSFIFELGFVFLLCFALYLAIVEHNIKFTFLFVGAALVSLGMNAADFMLRHAPVTTEISHIATGVVSVKTVVNALTALKWFICSGIFLKASEIALVERVALVPFTLNSLWPFVGFSPHFIRGAAALLLFSWLAIYSYPKISDDRRKLISLFCIMISGFVLFVSCGRVNTRGIFTGLFFNSYYIYFFWVLALPLAYACLSFEAISKRSDGGLIRLAVYVLSAGMIFLNALSIYNINLAIAQGDKHRRHFLDATTAFVDTHRSEADFSFFVSHQCPGNYAGKWLHQNGDLLWRRYTLAEALYPSYYRSLSEAKYVFCPDLPATPGIASLDSIMTSEKRNVVLK